MLALTGLGRKYRASYLVRVEVASMSVGLRNDVSPL